jgi:hypothetical protein
MINIFKYLKEKILKHLEFMKYIFLITILKICFSFCDCDSYLTSFYNLCIIILISIYNYYKVNDKKNIKKSIFSAIYLDYIASILSLLIIFILLTVSNIIPPLGIALNILMMSGIISNIVKGFFWLLCMILPQSHLMLYMINKIDNGIISKIIIILLLSCISSTINVLV